MNDVAYTLVQTNKERTVAARGIYGKKTGSKTKYCGLPSDHLTEAEKRKLNGPVNTYDMSIPHTYKELMGWPFDIRGEYLAKLMTMSPTNAQLETMLQTSHSSTHRLLSLYGLVKHSKGPRPKANAAQVRAWKQFLNSTAAPEPEPAAAPHQDISFSPDILSSLLDFLADNYTITIRLERK